MTYLKTTPICSTVTPWWYAATEVSVTTLTDKIPGALHLTIYPI